MTDIMLDLETMGTDCDAAIVQIGAVAFDFNTGRTMPGVYLADVSMYSCVAEGASITQDTVAWWAKQGGFTHASPPVLVRQALQGLQSYVWAYQPKRIWCQGPHFDIAILQWYAKRIDIELPWAFWDVCDCRTLMTLASNKGWVRNKKATHRADQDCLLQVEQLHSAMTWLNTWGWQ